MTKLRHHGVLVRLLRLVLLCVALVRFDSCEAITAVETTSIGRSVEATPESTRSDAAARHFDLAHAEGDEERSGQSVLPSNDQGAFDASGYIEWDEEFGELSAAGLWRRTAHRETRGLRHRDPIVELCCILVAPPRGPPAIDRTA